MTAHAAAHSFVPATPVPWGVAAGGFASPAETVELNGPTLNFSRDEEVFGEGERADSVYRVVSGAVRTFRILADGRRQICEFHLAGDCFGFEPSAVHRTSAEALGPTKLVAVRRSALLDNADTAPEFARLLWRAAVADLQRSQEHVLRLGHRSAAERVASFLLDVARRLGGHDAFDLPMSRQDIADYLGLTIETVSRSFTQLQGLELIAVSSCRHVRLADREALTGLCE
ncbi:helix-turn-helix domain-containing protein [Caulobacter sp. KR2-114]|uniref:helix-turn-helix domain-containing protein n=1 Tax=Caulobacter sp. KR2-114 TaxID=3400912 RepID=UPI003BFDF462